MFRSKLALGFGFLAGVGLLSASLGGGCSAGTGNTFTGGGGTGPSASSSSGNSTGSSSDGGGGGFIVIKDGGEDGPISDSGCVGQPFKGEQLPLDIYVMLDQTGSMDDMVGGGQTRWEAVTNAIATFVQQPSLKGVSVGLQYFALLQPNLTSSCNPADYATPEIEIAPILPGDPNSVAPQIIASMANHYPHTLTPLEPAIKGGIQHAKDWASSHPGRVVIHVLATDAEPGEPNDCISNPNDPFAPLVQAAAEGVNTSPKILTFVIGIGLAFQKLHQIAAAGGTGQAFLVTDGNANDEFLKAMNEIRGTAIGCQYKIPQPDAGMADYNQVNVTYTPAGGMSEFFPKVESKAKCPASGDAWYYDNNAAPTTIILCDATCDKVSNSPQGSQVDVVVGCETIVK